ncbi:MAG: globin [Actinomycetes bacterium]
MSEEITFYDKVGGHETFVAIADNFYDNLVNEPLLLAMYPKKDMDGAKERLRLFLEQYWGGPTTYSDTRGHPRLRMRHGGFSIGEAEKEAWLRCAHSAIIDLDVEEALKEELWTYFQYAAHSMMNQVE